MIQLVALNYIINNKDDDMLQLYGEEYFFEPQYQKVYKFIKEHRSKYGTIPDISTITDNFDFFDPLDTIDESREYITDKLYDEKVTNETSMIIDEIGDDFSVDAISALQKLKARLNAIAPPPNITLGTDIIATAPDRYEKLVDMMEHLDAYWFSTGLKELDLALDGGIRRGEELIIIFARTNNLKTWIAEKMAVAVWEEGYDVGFFSPEMTPDSIGYRFDTLYDHWDNTAIQGGSPEFDASKYKAYTHKLSKNKAKFVVTSPASFYNNVTVSAIKRWITMLDLKLVVIDGIKYMKNERCPSGRQSTTDRLTEISEDLMSLSVELGIPIIVVVQANREAARDKDGDVANDAPEIDTIRDSDGIAHNASRIISLIHKKTEKEGHTITAYINKNRYGQVGQKLIWKIDINVGQFTYIPNKKDGFSDATDPDAPVAMDGAVTSNISYGDTGDI